MYSILQHLPICLFLFTLLKMFQQGLSQKLRTNRKLMVQSFFFCVGGTHVLSACAVTNVPQRALQQHLLPVLIGTSLRPGTFSAVAEGVTEKDGMRWGGSNGYMGEEGRIIYSGKYSKLSPFLGLIHCYGSTQIVPVLSLVQVRVDQVDQTASGLTLGQRDKSSPLEVLSSLQQCYCIATQEFIVD